MTLARGASLNFLGVSEDPLDVRGAGAWSVLKILGASEDPLGVRGAS